MKQNLNKKQKKKYISISLIVLLVLILGTSYSWFTQRITGNKTNTVRSGVFSFQLVECDQDLLLRNAMPMSVEKGLETQVCTFTVTNTGSIAGDYAVYLDDIELQDDETKMKDEFIRYSLVKDDEEESVDNTQLLSTTGEHPNRLLSVGKLKTQEEDTYHLKLWIDQAADKTVMNTVFYGRIRIDIVQASSYSLTIDPNGGSYKGSTTISKEVVNKGDKITIEEPEREGYKFVGWEESPTGSIINSVVTVSSSNIVLRAKWKVTNQTEEDQENVAKINDNYYTSLNDAVTAAVDNDVIIMLKNTTESVITDKNIVIDLNEKIITGQEDYTITNNGTLQIINSGVIENTTGTGIINNGELTIGENDNNISQTEPQINAITTGIEQNGTFNYYDGRIEAEIGVSGEYNSTPPNYYPYIDHNEINNYQIVYLTNELTKAVAKTIDPIPVYYFNLQDAINSAVKINQPIYIIRDFEAAYELNVPSDSNINIDISGYNVKLGNTFTNDGTLLLTDSATEKGSTEMGFSLINNNQLRLKDIIILGEDSNNIILNNKDLIIENTTITAQDGYAIQNIAGTILTDEISIIKSNNYAIYNSSSNLELQNGTIYGLFNEQGNVTITNGSIIAANNYAIKNNLGNITIENGTVQSDNGKTTIYANGNKFTINGGTITSTSEDYATIRIHEGTFTINGGDITQNGSNSAIEVYDTLEVNGGRINSNSNTIHLNKINTKEGIVNVTNGLINGNVAISGYVKTTSSYYNYGTANISGGTITGTESGIAYLKTTNVSGGIISSNSLGIKNEDNLTVTGGTIKGNLYGIYNKKTLTIGQDDSSLIMNNPVIIGTSYGLYNDGGNVQLYDGIIKGQTAPYYGSISTLKDGTDLIEDIETVEDELYKVAYLEKLVNFLEVDNQQYNSLENAINAVTTSGTIKLIENGIVKSASEIPSDKNITLDLNGYNLNITQPITNLATFTLTDTSTSNSNKIIYTNTDESSSFIINSGTLAIEKTNLQVIYNTNGVTTSGTMTVKNSNLECTKNCINQTAGTLELTNNTINSATYGIYNSGGTITHNSGSITADTYGIYTTNVTIEDGEITADTAVFASDFTINNGVFNGITTGLAVNRGNNTINGGTFTAETAITGKYAGTNLTINNADINGTKIGLNTYDVDTTINNANIYGAEKGLYLEGKELVTINKATITSDIDAVYISVGTLQLETGNEIVIKGGVSGINLDSWSKSSPSYATVNIGQDDGEIISDDPNNYEMTDEENYIAPVIIGKNYGINVIVGVLNIYDGSIIGKQTALNGNFDKVPDGYTLTDSTITMDNEEYRLNTLNISEPFIQVGEKTYNTFDKAIENITTTNNVMKLINNGIVYKNKYSFNFTTMVTIDLNGYTLNIYNPINNTEKLTITDSVGTGKINYLGNSSESTVENTGELIVKNCNIQNKKVAGDAYTINSIDATLTVDNLTSNAGIKIQKGTANISNSTLTKEDRYIIYNTGTTTLNNNSITCTARNSFRIYMYGIYNKGDLTINGGNYLRNGSSNDPAISNVGTLTLNSGTIDSTGSFAIENSGGVFIMNDGEISSSSSALKNGSAYIYGGTVNGIFAYNSGSINIGKDDGIIDASQPIIVGRLSKTDGSINFYDGVMYYSDISQIDSIASDSLLVGDSNSGYYLVPASGIIRNKTTEETYTDITTAIEEAQSEEELQLINDVYIFNDLEISTDQNITMDLAGYSIITNKKIVNNGTLTIKDTTTSSGGITETEANTLITNNGTLNLNNINITTTEAIENNQTLTAENITITGTNGINNTENSTITLINSNIKTKKTAINNLGSINISGTYESQSSYAIYTASLYGENTFDNVNLTGSYGIYSNSLSQINITNSTVNSPIYINQTSEIITIDNSTLKDSLTNKGTSTITNSTIEQTLDGEGSTIKNASGTVNITSTTIAINHTGTIDNSEYNVIINNSANDVIISNCDINLTTTSKGIDNIIQNNNSGNIRYSASDIVANGTNIVRGIYSSDISTGTITIDDGTVTVTSDNQAYGIYIENGIVTMGIKDGDGTENANVSITNPIIKAVGSTGIGVKRVNGTFNYYDGKIIGSTAAKPDTTTNTEYNYEVVTNIDTETGYEYCILEYMK